MDLQLAWFREHMDIIFFVYGAAFVVMGIVILAQPRRESQFRLAGILWLLAAFGLSHGLNEWFDMWAIIRGTNTLFDAVRWITVTASFVFLFEFGRRLFNINAEARQGGAAFLLGWWLAPLVIGVIALVSLMSGDFRQTGTWLSRYFLCFPGAVLTGVGFLGYFRLHPDSLPLGRLRGNFRWTAFAFIAYGILAGLVVPKGNFVPAVWLNTEAFADFFHVPVQLFRAAMAIITAINIAGMLRLFTWESVEKLEEAFAREHESRLSFEQLSSQYQLILDSVGDGILVLDKDGMVTLLNSAGARMTGYGQADLAGKDPHTVFHHTKADGAAFPRTQCPIYLVLQDGTPRLVTDDVFWRKDGKSFPVEYICTPIRKDRNASSPDGAVVVFGDVAWRRESEEKQKKLQAQVLHIQKMDAVGTLTAGIAHDFNNMLTVIQGHVDISRMKLDRDAPLQKNLNIIYDTALRAASLTRQLLAFGRRQPMDMKPVDANSTIENILKMLSRVIGETIQIETDLKKGLWAIKADEGNLEQVIMNLVVNARDAMPHGGTISITTDNMVLDEEVCREKPGAKPGKYVCMTVRDTGCGMSEEVRKRIFEPFFSTKEVGKGTGLGLAVVYGIIKEHEGFVYADSKPGEGTAFRIYLPALVSVRSESQGNEPLMELSDNAGKGERILLVEDNHEVRVFDASTLREYGYEVLVASCVTEALDIFNRERGLFDLVLSDVGLPDRSGLQLVEEVRLIKPGIKVLLCSGYMDKNSQWPLIKERDLPFIQKPFTVDALLRAVRRAIDR